MNILNELMAANLALDYYQQLDREGHRLLKAFNAADRKTADLLKPAMAKLDEATAIYECWQSHVARLQKIERRARRACRQLARRAA
jgi:hypothetical protein